MNDLQKRNRTRHLIRKRNQILDFIAQYRIRIQVAQSYQLWAVAEAGGETITRFEETLDEITTELNTLGAD